jgi:hypothetical protein
MSATQHPTRFARQWSPEQLADIVLRHVAGESARSIARSYDVSPSTITRLLASPDITAMVEERRAEVAAEAERAEAAVRESEQRAAERERKSRSRAAERAAKQGSSPEMAERFRAAGEPKKQGVGSDGSTLVTSKWAGLPHSETQAEFIRRKQAERELPVMQPTLIVAPTMQRAIWPEGDDYDRQDVEQLAIHLHEDLGCPSADILNALLAAKPGVSYLATARPDFRLVPIEPEQ